MRLRLVGPADRFHAEYFGGRNVPGGRVIGRAVRSTVGGVPQVDWTLMLNPGGVPIASGREVGTFAQTVAYAAEAMRIALDDWQATR